MQGGQPSGSDRETERGDLEIQENNDNQNKYRGLSPPR